MCENSVVSFVELLEKQKELRVHTGNINSWGELKKLSFQNGAEELGQCLRMQLEKWKPTCEQFEIWSKNGNVCLCQSEWCKPSIDMVAEEDRADLRITLKVFLNEFRWEDVRNCVESVCEELKTDTVERLIISFPDLEAKNDATEAEETDFLLERIKPLWTELENLVENGHKNLKVLSLGVADFELPELRALVEWAPRVPPALDHYNIIACCTVPPELKAYAKEKEIVLLTHNDPKPFIPHGKLAEICTSHLGVKADCCSSWGVNWVGRYVVMIRSRSVLASKGYVVDFKKRCQKGACA